MFGSSKKITTLTRELELTRVQAEQNKSMLEAISRSMAVIEFEPNGTIITANDNFTATVGYHLNEIVGNHHRMFCEPQYSRTAEYNDFWQEINNGAFLSGQFARLTKEGRKIWLEASYNPIFDRDKNLVKVVKFATDITDKVTRRQEQESMVNAISRSMAIIEFNMNGEIITANENFLAATHYALHDIQGQHHRIFCESSLSDSSEYAGFWASLNRGEFQSGRYKRVDKHGNVLWLEASYNPIFDASGHLVKVIKFAVDITARVINATETREFAAETSEQADISARQGKDIVRDTVKLMDSLSRDVGGASERLQALNTQADKINNIVNTISGIADQTNLLALNAAIEAARAGEQGRGFAVVADEVRQLAARTSSSTTEIAEVVKKNLELSSQATSSMAQSTEHIHSGTVLVSNLSDTIEGINAGVMAIGQAIERLED